MTRRHFRRRAATFACVALALCACRSPEPEAPARVVEPEPTAAPVFAELPPRIDHRAFVRDLLFDGERGPAHALRATVEVPEDGAILVYDARARPETEAPEISIRLDGDEILRRPLQGHDGGALAMGFVSLDDHAGRDVVIELVAHGAGDGGLSGFSWRRATVETPTAVERLARGRGRNLLFVVVDTLRADHTSLHGYARPTTPHLDALAERSLVFDQAFAAASWTLPSTATLLTGLAPPVHGSISGGDHLGDRFETVAESLQAVGVTTFAASANPLIGHGMSFSQGFETFSHQPWERAEALNRSLLGWLDQVGAETRWFAYLHYIDPHDPYDAPSPGDRWVDPAYDGAFTDPTLLNQLYHAVNWGHEPPRAVGDEDLQYLRDAYDGEILYWDTSFGELLAALDQRGLLDETIVVVTSDHGEEFLDHGRFKHGHQLFDESLRVPLVLHAPGLLAPARRDDPVSLQGVYRALLQLMRTGLAPRDGDLLRSPADRPVFGHLRVPVTPDDPLTRFTVASVRAEPWWLVYEADRDRQRLFDVAADPAQRYDRARAHPETARRLRELLDAWLAHEATGQRPAEPPDAIDPEALEQLRALGYVQ